MPRTFSRFAPRKGWGLWLCLVPLLGVGCGDGDEAGAPRDATETEDAQLEEQLRALGYVDFVAVDDEALGKSGVTLYVPGRAQPGYSLFNTRSSNQALLIDMEGEVVHRWHNPGLEGTWHHIEMLPDGDLLVIDKNGYLARLDWDSNLRWQLALHVHHDLEVGAGGELYVLDRDVSDVPGGFGSVPIVNDAIAKVSADGELQGKVYFHDLLTDHVGPKLWTPWLRSLLPFDGASDPFDLFHANSIERVERDLGGLPTAGTFLVCTRNLDLVAFVNLETREIVWSWGEGILERPHQPSVMQNGNILVFDNGSSRGWSRVVELDPARETIVWEYRAEPPESFFSEGRGGAQELSGGNVLITESNEGRVLEVTREGEIVWEFYNPDVVEGASGRIERGTIYRMTRIEEAVVARLLGAEGSG